MYQHFCLDNTSSMFVPEHSIQKDKRLDEDFCFVKFKFIKKYETESGDTVCTPEPRTPQQVMFWFPGYPGRA